MTKTRFVMYLGLMVMVIIVLLSLSLIRTVNAAVSVYSVAQGVETDAIGWITGVPGRGINNLKMQVGTITFDSAYPTGGEVLDLSGTFPNAVLMCVVATQSGLTFEYVHAAASAPATGKVKVYAGDGSEVANGTDIYTVATEYFAIGW